MKFVKALILTILSLLLFLSLSVFGLAYVLHSTLLNPDFVVSEVNKLDISAVAGDLVAEQVGANLPADYRFLKVVIRKVVTEVVSAQEPWLKEQLSAAVYSGYDYLRGKADRLVITVSLDPLKEDLVPFLQEALKPEIIKALPPELAQAAPALVDQYLNEYFQQFTGAIPSEFVIDEGYIPPEIMVQIIQARQIISYFQKAYYGLLGLMVLLLLGILAINRNVRGSARELGITFTTYGALEFAGVLLARNYLPFALPLKEIPSSLQVWLLVLAQDLITPLQTFSIGLLAAGIVLLVVSFVYPKREAVAD